MSIIYYTNFSNIRVWQGIASYEDLDECYFPNDFVLISGTTFPLPHI